MDYRDIEAACAAHGLIARGGFHPSVADGAPAGARTLVLVGNAGPALWRAFCEATPPSERASGAHPLDGWTRRAVGAIAEKLGARAVYPFDGPPYAPFQRWALRAGGVFTSPIGTLIHPVYGLWHAYRGALAFAAKLALPPPPTSASPCESCASKPCLTACPVGAFRIEAGPPARYDVPRCVAHVTSAAGTDCLGGGCLARRACPVGRDYAYGSEQARFHMRKFLAAQAGKALA
jgi:hypothetical protein